MREYKNGLVYLLLVALFLFPLVSSYATDWEMYGGDYSPLWNAQYGSIKGNFSIFTTVNIGVGMVADNLQVEVQPIIWGFDSPEGATDISKVNNYLVIPTTNYLQVYNKNGILFSEIATGGNVMTQIDILDWNNDGLANEIEGIWKVNTTQAQYRIYSYNTTTETLALTYAYNLTANATTYFTGMRRCGYGMGCMIKSDLANSNYTNVFYMFNQTAILTSDLHNTTNVFNKVLSFYDMDNDGKIEYLTHSIKDVLIFNRDGTTRYYGNSGVSANIVISDAGMLSPDATNQWKFYIVQYNNGVVPSTITTTLYKLDGTTVWSSSVNPYTTSSVQTVASAVYDNYETIEPVNCTVYLFGLYTICSPFTGGNDIAIQVESRTGTVTSFLSKLVYRGSDGTILRYENMSFTYPAITGESSLILADTDKVAGQDFNYIFGNLSYSSGGYDTPYTLFFNATFGTKLYCSIADLNVDGSLDEICYSSSATKIYYSNSSNQNSVITSVSYSPTGSTITNSDTLTILIHATDLELDNIIYAVKCSDSDTWHESPSVSSVSCSPFAIGIYNVSVAVKDGYHTSYSSIVSKQISVIAGGGGGTNGTLYTCGNNICESSLGENSINCPVDCTAVVIGGGNGTIAIPYDLVDPNNSQRGILPELWTGFLLMLSQIIFPMSVIIISVIIVATLIAFVVLMQNLLRNILG